MGQTHGKEPEGVTYKGGVGGVRGTIHVDVPGPVQQHGGYLKDVVVHDDKDPRHLLDWTHEHWIRRVQEGDTLWHLSEKYLGDGNKWPYLQAACELDRDPLYLIPGRPITGACISRAKEESNRYFRRENLHDHRN